MEKQEFSCPIANNRLLIFKADPANESEMRFAEEFKEVTKTKPANLQEFIIRLVELQKTNSKKSHENTGG
jgi:hypothetical protein